MRSSVYFQGKKKKRKREKMQETAAGECCCSFCVVFAFRSLGLIICYGVLLHNYFPLKTGLNANESRAKSDPNSSPISVLTRLVFVFLYPEHPLIHSFFIPPLPPHITPTLGLVCPFLWSTYRFQALHYFSAPQYVSLLTLFIFAFQALLLALQL